MIQKDLEKPDPESQELSTDLQSFLRLLKGCYLKERAASNEERDFQANKFLGFLIQLGNLYLSQRLLPKGFLVLRYFLKEFKILSQTHYRRLFAFIQQKIDNL